ncbi:MAG: hypothetical protein KF704_01810 [Crocinitomicaceae bacterium]|nr:hypothetical protein [Crocinitomicaceae bacterium]
MSSLKKFILSTIIPASLFLITACKKEQLGSSTENSPTAKTYQNLSDFFATNKLERMQFVTINNSDFEADTIITNLGTHFFVLKDAFETMDGTPVTGNIEIGFIELYDKKDLLLLGHSNMGYLQNGLTPLISGGQFYISAKQNGQELRLKENHYCYIYHIPAGSNTTPAFLFHRLINEQNQVFWSKAESIEVENGPDYMSVNEYDGAYYTSNNTLGWAGIAHFASMTGAQSPLSLQLPSGHTSENTAVYVSIDGVTSLGELHATQSGIFASVPGYTLPIGTSVHFVIISHTTGTLKAAIVPAMITSNHIQFVQEPEEMSSTELSVLLNSLP